MRDFKKQSFEGKSGKTWLNVLSFVIICLRYCKMIRFAGFFQG